MRYITAALALAFTYTNLTLAALCIPKGVAGIGDSVKTFPPDYQFLLFARNSSGALLGINSTNTGDFAPVKLDDASVSLFGFPEFELINGQLRTYDKPYRYLTTKTNPLLEPAELYTSPEGVGMPVSVVANNVSCGLLMPKYAVRFEGVVPVSSGSGAVNGSFAVGSTLTSPILEPVLPVSKLISEFDWAIERGADHEIGLLKPIDLIISFF